jgi:hypothetical protein
VVLERLVRSCLHTLTLLHTQVEELAKAKLERPKRLRQQAAREWREIDDGAPPAACRPSLPTVLQHGPPPCMFFTDCVRACRAVRCTRSRAAIATLIACSAGEQGRWCGTAPVLRWRSCGG